MRWILHRGNNAGPNSVENALPELIKLLNEGFELEVDLWYTNSKLYLGHDFPQYEIDESFLDSTGLWIHCKDAATLEYMNTKKKYLHYFYHTDEDYVLTSKGYVWCYVGKPALEGSVIVMPEKSVHSYSWNELVSKNCLVCSDYLEEYVKKLL
jgi:hypothetical protein